MKDLMIRPANAAPEGAPVPSYLAVAQRENRLFSWWYRIASPPRPAQSATFKEKERFRRGRTGSQIIPALFVMLLISVPSAIGGGNSLLLPIIIGGICALILATILNRAGMVNLAGFIVVIAFMAYPMADIATSPGGLGMTSLPLFGFLILPLLCAVSFVPEWGVFIVALINIAFTLFSLNSLPQTAELNALLFGSLFAPPAFASVVTPIILSQLIVSVVAYLWVHSTTQALKRADRAEEIAKLEHDLALQAEAAAQQNRQLEASIQKIVEVHARAANGDFNARVPLTEDNVLWQISGSLNNLLSRLQRLRSDTAETQQLKYALQQAREENRRLTKKLNETLAASGYSTGKLNEGFSSGYSTGKLNEGSSAGGRQNSNSSPGKPNEGFSPGGRQNNAFSPGRPNDNFFQR